MISLVLQIAWHARHSEENPVAQKLHDPPSLTDLRLASFGESEMASRFMMLYLQSSDIQPGIVIPYRDLDYRRVGEWLETSLILDERDTYPLFAATGLYLGVEDEGRKRIMLDFIYREFLENPDERWQWLARGIWVAKYRLHDLPLALRYAEALARGRTSRMPDWVSEMQVFILHDMDEIDSERILIGALLANGKIVDRNEKRLLERELARIEEQKKSGVLW